MLNITSSVFRQCCLLFFLVLIAYFTFMDFMLYSRVQNYAVRPSVNAVEYHSMMPCDFNPLCVVTVKGLTLDHPNHFVLSPLAAIVDSILGISKSWTWISPNMISYFHVLLAIVAGKFVSNDALHYRRIGVLLFQVRTWLDDLDGHVARKRKNIDGERTEVGSLGFWIDGICDGLGCIFFITGLFYFLARNPTRRNYEKLQPIIISSTERGDTTTLQARTLRRYPRYVLKTILLLAGHLIVCSIGWNRCISFYQDLLETDGSVDVTGQLLYDRQSDVIKSGSFWVITFAWKLINFHAALDYFLLAVFFDKVWEYARSIRYFGYVLVLVLIYFTEFHFLQACAYIHGIPTMS